MKINGFRSLFFIILVAFLLACSPNNDNQSPVVVQPSPTFSLPMHLKVAGSESLTGTWMVIVDSNYRYNEANASNNYEEKYRLQTRKILTVREEPGELYVTECASLQTKRYTLEDNMYVLGSDSDDINESVVIDYSQMSFSAFNHLSGSFERRSEKTEDDSFTSIEIGILQGIKISNSIEVRALDEVNNSLISISSAVTDERQLVTNSDYAITCYNLSYRSGNWHYKSPFFTDVGSHSGQALVVSAHGFTEFESTQQKPAATDVVMRYQRTHSSGLETDTSTNAYQAAYNADSSYLDIDFVMDSLSFRRYERSYGGQEDGSVGEFAGDFIFSETAMKADINANTTQSSIDFRAQLSF